MLSVCSCDVMLCSALFTTETSRVGVVLSEFEFEFVRVFAHAEDNDKDQEGVRAALSGEIAAS